ncbi:MAG: LamG domain-containing protein, partial [Candidatus Desantisbacteria bacterium]
GFSGYAGVVNTPDYLQSRLLTQGAFNATLANDSASVYADWYAGNNSFAASGTYFSQPVILNSSDSVYSRYVAALNWSWFESAGLTRDANGGNDSVVLSMHFENDTKDSSRYNNSGILSGNTTAAMLRDCIVGKCLSFDGSDDYVNLTDAPFDFERTNAFTLSAWIKTSYNGTSPNPFFSKGLLWEPGYELHIISGNLTHFYLAAAGVQVIEKVGSMNISDNSWHHVTGTYDGTSSPNGVKVYIDGIDRTQTGAYSSSLTNSTLNDYNLLIGYTKGWNKYFNGSIDEAHVFNRSLSASEVWELYTLEYNRSGKGNSGFVQNFTNVSLALRSKNYSFNDSGLVGWWDLGDSSDNETVANKTLDLSGNGNDGTGVS